MCNCTKKDWLIVILVAIPSIAAMTFIRLAGNVPCAELNTEYIQKIGAVDNKCITADGQYVDYVMIGGRPYYKNN